VPQSDKITQRIEKNRVVKKNSEGVKIMKIINIGENITSNFKGELINGVVKDIHKSSGIFVHYEKPVSTSLGMKLEKAWVKIPNAEYREIESVGIIPTKQLVLKD